MQDDIAGLGTELPGLLNDLDWTPQMVTDWNRAANETVARARALMLSKKKYNWQMFAEMAAPSRSICENGTSVPPRDGQLPFPGMRALCSPSAPAAKELPWLMHVFSGPGLDHTQFSCQPEIGVVPTPIDMYCVSLSLSLPVSLVGICLCLCVTLSVSLSLNPAFSSLLCVCSSVIVGRSR